MHVELWVRDDLARRPDGETGFRIVAAWNDTLSANAQEAAERAWRVCALAPHVLSPVEQRWRAAWDDGARGQGFSVGDVVIVGDAALRCTPTGFEPAADPSR